MSNTQIINELIMSVTGGVTGSNTPASDFNYLDLPAHGDATQFLWYELKGTEWSFNVMPHEKSIVIYSRDKKVEWYITPDGPIVASVMEFPGVCQREFTLHNMSPDVVSFTWRSANVDWKASEMAVEDCAVVRFGKIPVVVPTGWFCKNTPPDEMDAQNAISEAIIPAVLGRPLAPFEHFQCNVSQRKGVYSFSVTLTYNDIPRSDTKYFTLKTASDPIAVKYIVRTIAGIEI